MADRKKALPENVAGDFFVDSSCIDCDTCRQLAPATFGETGEMAFVRAQPTGPEEERRAFWALLACPTGSIGTDGRNRSPEIVDEFPLQVEDEVFYNGFTSPHSFGGSSYFVQHPAGNWLIDCPRYVRHLVEHFEAMGGVSTIFLTHRDDVADAARYAGRFGSRRIIHAADRRAQPDAEVQLEGEEPVTFGEDFTVIPTPGHTRGHCVLLYRSRFLFSGDHLWWSRRRQDLHASREVCWYSWPEQTRSMMRLLEHEFEWVLPGHGERRHLESSRMRAALRTLVRRMRS